MIKLIINISKLHSKVQFLWKVIVLNEMKENDKHVEEIVA